MLSQKCKYAIRTVLYLSIEGNKTHPKGGKEISTTLKIPEAYTGKILQELAKKNIITSVKGPGGGFYLSEKNLHAPMINIIEIIDGLSFFDSCGIGLSKCSNEHPCPIHNDFKIAREHLKKTFINKSVLELAKEIKINDFTLVR